MKVEKAGGTENLLVIRTIVPSLLIAAGLAFACFAPASAQQVRAPQTGDPAYNFSLPSGWTATHNGDANNLLITFDGCGCAVSLYVANLDTTAITPAEFAAQVLKDAKARPYARSAPDAIAGIPGNAFFTTMTSDRLRFKLVIVKLDVSHYATMTVLTRPDMSRTNAAALAQLLSAVRFTAVAPPAVVTAPGEPVRLPANGDPAFAFIVPAGWTSKYGAEGALTISAADCLCAVVFAMENVNTVTTPTTVIAANAFKVMGAPSYSSTAPGAIAGVPGDAYFSAMNANSIPLGLKLVVARVDASHYAEMIVIVPASPPPATTTALDALLTAVRLTAPP